MRNKAFNYKLIQHLLVLFSTIVFVFICYYLLGLLSASPVLPDNSLGVTGEVTVRLNSGTSVVLPAKFDTGSDMSSLDLETAKKIKVYSPLEGETAVIKTSTGTETREVVKLAITIKGITKEVNFNLSDRNGLAYPVIIGHRDLKGFVITPGADFSTTATASDIDKHTTAVMKKMAGLAIAGALILFVRQFLGIKTSGVFAPLLIGLSLEILGTGRALTVYAQLIFFGIMLDMGLIRLRLQSLARLVLVLNFIFVYLYVLSVFHYVRLDSYYYALPLIIVTYIIKGFDNKSLNSSRTEAVIDLIMTLLISLLVGKTYTAFTGLALTELQIMTVFAGAFVVSLVISFYEGPRLSEVFRFSSVLWKTGGVMGMNYRNSRLISNLNPVWAINMVNNKAAYKRLLSANGIPCPKTLSVISGESELDLLNNLTPPFVIKPSAGLGGKGILLVQHKDNDRFIKASGESISLQELNRQVKQILDGVYSLKGQPDEALVEEMVEPCHFMRFLSIYNSLPDIRLIIYGHQIIAGMIRIPTKKSEGKANLSKGALGAALDLRDGEIVRLYGSGIDERYQNKVLGLRVPYWEEIIKIAREAGKLSGLKYLGIDIVVTSKGPMVMECNARPGMEIQNVIGQNLRYLVENIKDKNRPAPKRKPKLSANYPSMETLASGTA